MKLISWNINSVNARKTILSKLIDEYNPDIIMLQEIKCIDSKFPYNDFKQYKCFVNGQKQYNGVAIMTKTELSCGASQIIQLGGKDEARCIGLDIDSTYFICFYVPCGASSEEAYEYKKKFLSDMLVFLEKTIEQYKKIIIGGDINVAINNDYVQCVEKYSHSVLCRNDVRELMQEILNKGFDDKLNQRSGLYSWWDYRTPNEGLRIDYVLSYGVAGEQILLEKYRRIYLDGVKPSDHCPVLFKYKYKN